MVLRLRGSARAFYRTCTEEQKGNYRALIQEMEKRFTPVRIQALESSIFRERRQKIGESVDAYAQDLQQLFQKAYPKALQGSDDARVMGRAVLSNQFIGGLLSELKRKVAYIEGATFSELWQKARFEEARQLDLARVSWKQQPRRDDPKGAPPPQRQDQRQQPGLAGQFGGGQRRNPQSVKCYNLDRMGHFAKDCRATRRMAEAQTRTPNRYDPIPSSRSTATRAATVVSVQGECQSHGEDDSLKWVYGMYGVRHADDSTSDCVPPRALVDTGCPATIISREICRKILDKEREAEPPELWMERATKRLQHPSLSLKAYCGTELSIGAEIAVQVTTPYHTVHGSVLVQKDTPVDMLLGTDLMPALGIKVLDADGRSLLSEEQPVQVAAEQATRVSNEPVPLEEQSVTTEQPIKVAVGSHPPSEQLTQVSNQPITAIKEQFVEVTVESISPSQQPAQTILKSIPITPVINESIPGEEQPIPIEQPTQATPAAATRQQPAQATVADESAAVKRQQPTQATVVQNVLTAGSKDWKRSLHPCRKVGNRRYTTPEYSVGGQIPVRLVQACKLPGRCGKLLKARMQRTPSMSPFEWLFEPKARLHNQALEIADAVVKPKGKCLLLPVTNSSGSPTLLRRGQVLGWLQPAEVIDSTGDVDRMVEDSDDVTVDSEVCVTPEIPGVRTSSGEIHSESDGEIHSESDGETHSESDGANSDDETVEVYTTPDTPGVRMDNEAEGDTHSESETPEPMLEMDEERVAPNSARQSHLKAMLHLDQAEVSLCEREALENFLLQNADIFALGNTELGRTDVVTHSIDTGDHRPIHQHPRRIPFALRSQVDEMVQDMLDQGVIQPTSSPWASPIVLVKKKDGSMRFCVDYRQLNAITKLDVYPLPRIDDTLDVLAGARLFTTLDLASGYWQVSLDPAAREKTAFVTHAGLYEFEVMPFGLCNAPATFQRLMEVVLAGLTRNQCFVYLDDILIISRTWEEHLGNLQLVFDRLRSAGLRLRPKKCPFAQQKALYLGHIVSEQGIEVDTQKVDRVRHYPVPTNLKTLQRFLGLVSYYRRFIPNLSRIASPLYCLTRKNTPFLWSHSCRESFEKLKALLTSTPVLAFPNFQQPFILETDASGCGLGAVLAQQQEDGSTRPIAYASRGLQKHEQNYSISELEALAVVWTSKHFHVYLYGHHCTVFTDHSALKSLLNTPPPSGKLARWGLAIQELDLDIQYRSGESNANADALSRVPPLMDQPNIESAQEKSPPLLDQSNTESLQNELNPLVARQEAEPVLVESEAPTEQTEAPTEEWQKMQRPDGEFATTIAYLENETLPSDPGSARRLVLTAEQFSLIDGVLYHVQTGGHLMLVVPEVLRYKLFQEAHEGMFSGHLREAKIYSQLSKHYWWPGIRADVRKWCKACLVCATHHTGRAAKPPLCPIPVAGPFDCVGVDVLQLPRTLDGNQYAVVFVDYLTKWPEVFAVPNQSAETIANLFVREIIKRTG